MNSLMSRLMIVSGLFAIAAIAVIALASSGTKSPTTPQATLALPPGSNSTVVTEPVASGTATAAMETASLPSAITGSFAILRRAAIAADALPAAVLRSVNGSSGPTGLANEFGVNPTLARFAGSPGGTGIWFVPGTSNSCLLDVNGGGGCGPNDGTDGAAHEGMFTAIVPVDGGPPTVTGILPDGATVEAVGTNGQPLTGVQLSGQTYSLPAGAASFTLHLKDGTTVTHAMPASATPPAPAVAPSAPANTP